MVDALGPALAFLAQTQFLSHVTRRLVENFGRAPWPQEAVVVVLHETRPCLGSAIAGVIESICLSPVPKRFVVLREAGARDLSLFVGVLLDDPGQTGEAAVSWTAIDSDRAVSVVIPANGVGLVLGGLQREGGDACLELLKIATFGLVDDCVVLAATSDQPP